MSEEICSNFLDDMSSKICDMIWNDTIADSLEEGLDGSLYISDIQAIDVLNHVITGSFWWLGEEYSFEAESGNNNGWVWRSIDKDKPIPEVELVRTKWVLQPSHSIVKKAILKNEGQFLLDKWDGLLTQNRFKDLASKYSYDRHFQPGSKTETYWRDKADQGGFVIVSEEEAIETRNLLNSNSKGEAQ